MLDGTAEEPNGIPELLVVPPPPARRGLPELNSLGPPPPKPLRPPSINLSAFSPPPSLEGNGQYCIFTLHTYYYEFSFTSFIKSYS